MPDQTETHIEVVHTGPRQFHSRLQHPNGRFSWVTQSFKTKRSAYEAIEVLPGFVTYVRRETGGEGQPDALAVFKGGVEVPVFEVEVPTMEPAVGTETGEQA